VLSIGDRLDFEALLQRIHPADSRVRLLAETTPAVFVAFDLLAIGDRSVLEEPLRARRALLTKALTGAGTRVFLTRASEELATARAWFETFEGAGLDGIVAKALQAPYSPDKRTMIKVKHDRTADCVVAGYRWHKTSTPERPLLGSLLLGLYNADRALQHVGVSASFPTARRAELVQELAPYVVADFSEHPWSAWAEASTHESGRLPGAVSRWNAKKDLSWVPLRPELVVEVAYDHMEGTRFRHTAQFRRWRPDRDATSCTYVQLEVPVRYDLSEVLLTP
jgi:ATP-dependent DNA ligase